MSDDGCIPLSDEPIFKLAKCEKHGLYHVDTPCTYCTIEATLLPIATAAKKYIEGKSGQESCDAYAELKEAVKQWDDSTTENGR